MTWQERAAAIIALAHETIPADADLKARRRMVREARPWEFNSSWGRKAWGRAARGYLSRYEMPDRAAALKGLPLSPMERRHLATLKHEEAQRQAGARNVGRWSRPQNGSGQ